MRIPMHSLLPLFALAGALAGCANMTGPLFEAPPGQVGAIDTGTYPNLNIAPRVAASQLSAEEKAARTARLASAQSGQTRSGPGAPVRSEADLRRLASDGGRSTLEAIEGPQSAQ